MDRQLIIKAENAAEILEKEKNNEVTLRKIIINETIC